ncbi:MAG: DUF4302 domain-containing protein [Paludibacteraceae bacterium]|nr:DUF4302 domain-containing protein [Paludibacteraceae bacterium]
MKAKYLFISLALVGALCACSRDEESLFDKSAAERAQEALNNANTVLAAPENGWEMLYFANTESRGYNLIVKFDSNGKVVATAKNSLTTGNQIMSDESTWEVKLDYGPILTFDTYNKELHAWADPQEDGDGYLGDYEFLILHADANYVKLKGKKHSAYCYLYPMEAGKSASDYFAEVEAAQQKLCANGNIFHLGLQDKEYLLHDASSGLFSLTGLGQVPDPENALLFPFAVRKNGLQLSFAFSESGDTWYEISGDRLVSAKSAISVAAPATYFSEYLTLAGGTWTINITDVNDATKSAINTLNQALKKAYTSNKKAAVQGLAFKQNDENTVALIFSYLGSSNKATEMKYLYTISLQGDNMNIAYVGPADTNAEKVLTTFSDLETLLKTFEGTFASATDNALNPTNGIQLTESSNTSVWFKATGKL